MKSIDDMLAELPPKPEAPPHRTPKLKYLQASAKCLDCEASVSGDWGLVPDRCEVCDERSRSIYYQAESRLFRAELAVLKAAAEKRQEQHGYHCIIWLKPNLDDCTCGYDDMSKVLEHLK